MLAFVVSCSGDEPPPSRVTVVKADVWDISKPLRELVKLHMREDLDRGKEAEPVRPLPALRGSLSAVPEVDPVLQDGFGQGLIPNPLVNFEGMGTGMPDFTMEAAPPDTNGDIGPNHYVQTVNLAFSVFNRAGVKLLGPLGVDTLFAGFPGACAQTNDGDPTVRYDSIADRWVIAQFSVNGGDGPFFQCVAVSATSDPTGAWNRYQFSYTAFNDYPKVALWPDAYYVTYNMFAPVTFQFLGGKACALDRAQMIAGAAATMQCFDTGDQFGGLLASDLDGTTLPPTGSPNYHLALDTFSTLAFWKFHVDFATPANSTFTGPTTIPITTFAALCNFSACVPQPGTTNRLDPISDRLMNRLAYRNFGTHESLVANHSVTAGSGGGVRFYELRTPSTTPTLFQEGTYAPDSAFRWMGSIAMDSVGNIGLGFSVSSATISPSVRYTGRLATDPLGTMGQGEATIVSGAGAQTGGLTRWGDYSSLTLDPVDDCTFWYTQEYIGANGSFNWRTRVGSFKFNNCGAPGDDFSITPVPASQNVTAGMSTQYTIQTAVLSGMAQSITLSASGLPTGISASFNPPMVTAGQSSTLTLTVALSVPTGSTLFTITGNGTAVTHSTDATVNVTNNNQSPTVQITAPANGATVSGNAVAVTANASDPDGTVASVRFDLPDGSSVTDTTAPYSTTWSSLTVADGSHVIRATATDNIGFTTETTVTVNVVNGAANCVNGTFNATDVPVSIPDNDPVGATSNLSAPGNGTVTALSFSVNITHTYRGDLRLTLISPGGMQFVVKEPDGADSADNVVITNQAITAFNGQAAGGQWRLLVVDVFGLDVGTINSWSLAITAFCETPTTWSKTATPNIPTIDNGQVCSTLTVDQSGDAANAKLDINGRHDYRSKLRGTLAHNGVTVTAFPVKTFPNGFGTFKFTNRPISGLSGSATGTWTLCVIDTDAFGDTGILKTWTVHD
jgi:subtilisin-like proprotein convertase family protein